MKRSPYTAAMILIDRNVRHLMARWTLAALLVFASTAKAGTLGWRVPEKEWGAWHDPANWALENPDGEAAGRIPTAEDRFFGEQTFRFDLGGKTGVIGSWGIGSWIARDLFLTNGTLEVAANWPIHGGLIEICNGRHCASAPVRSSCLAQATHGAAPSASGLAGRSTSMTQA